MVLATLLTMICMSGCEGAPEQATKEKTTTVADEQAIMLMNDVEEETTVEVTTEELTTEEETTVAAEETTVEEVTTVVVEETTTQVVTTEKVTTPATTTQETTTKKPVKVMAAKPTTTPATTAKEVATEEQTTAAPVVEKNTKDFSKAKEAFKNYVAANYNNVSGYDAIVLNNTPVLFVVLNNGDERLLSYYNNSVIDNDFGYDYFDYNYTTGNSIKIDMGQGTDEKWGTEDRIYKLNNAGNIVVDSRNFIMYDNGVFSYYKMINDVRYDMASYSEFESSMVENGFYGKHEANVFTLTAGCGTIDDAFAMLESRIK